MGAEIFEININKQYVNDINNKSGFFLRLQTRNLAFTRYWQAFLQSLFKT